MTTIHQRTSVGTYRPVTRPVDRPVTTITKPGNTRHSAHLSLVRDATIPPWAGHLCTPTSRTCRHLHPIGVIHV
jgi:hypothetical protein